MVCFDDCDAILYDDLALEPVEGGIGHGQEENIVLEHRIRTLMAEGMPNSFEFNGGVVFITNIKFDNVKSRNYRTTYRPYRADVIIWILQ